MSLRLKFCLHYCEKLMGNIGRRLPCGNELTYKNGEIWSLVNLLAMQPEKIWKLLLKRNYKISCLIHSSSKIMDHVHLMNDSFDKEKKKLESII